MARLKQSLPGAPPAAGVGRRGIHGHLPYLLRQANAVTRLALDRALADLEMTLPQFSALQMIGAYQPLSSADLARLTWLTPQTVNAIVRNLETRAAIVRSPHDAHGRILNVELTAKGRRLLAQCRKRADRITAKLEAGLTSASDQEAVRRWLTYVATELGQHDGPPFLPE